MISKNPIVQSNGPIGNDRKSPGDLKSERLNKTIKTNGYESHFMRYNRLNDECIKLLQEYTTTKTEYSLRLEERILESKRALKEFKELSVGMEEKIIDLKKGIQKLELLQNNFNNLPEDKRIEFSEGHLEKIKPIAEENSEKLKNIEKILAKIDDILGRQRDVEAREEFGVMELQEESFLKRYAAKVEEILREKIFVLDIIKKMHEDTKNPIYVWLAIALSNHRELELSESRDDRLIPAWCLQYIAQSSENILELLTQDRLPSAGEVVSAFDLGQPGKNAFSLAVADLEKYHIAGSIENLVNSGMKKGVALQKINGLLNVEIRTLQRAVSKAKAWSDKTP